MRIVCRRFAKKSQDGDTMLNRSILGPPTRGLPLEVYNPTIYIELPFQKLYKMAPNSNLAHCALFHFHAYDVRAFIDEETNLVDYILQFLSKGCVTLKRESSEKLDKGNEIEHLF